MNTDEAYILSYIKGTLSAKEMEECDILMSSSPEFSATVNDITKSYHLLANLEAQKKINTEIAWNRLNRKISMDKTKKLIWSYTRNVAAILLPLFLLQQYVIQPLLNKTPVEIITLHSAPGIITKAILPDGSEVWLNSQSELTYPRQFTGNERTVQLVGEAYFKVVSDKKNRFNVVTPDKTTISAYGTEFNVNAYKQDAHYKVTLAKGNVDVSLDNLSEKQSLIPGQKAVVNPLTKMIEVVAADTYVETAWKDGKMVFRREGIKNIAEKLSRKFGVIIRVEGNITNDYQFTATFTNEALENILELLKLSTSIDYSITNQEKLADDTFSKRIITIICK